MEVAWHGSLRVRKMNAAQRLTSLRRRNISLEKLLVVIPVMIVIGLRYNTFFEQASQVVGVYCITQEKRPRYMEDLLHGPQIGGVREKYRTRERNSIFVMVSVGRNHNLADCVVEIVGVVVDLILFGLIKPDDDCAMVRVGPGSHDHWNDYAQEVVALLDLGWVAGQSLEAAVERGVHVVELIGRDPGVVSHVVGRQVNEELLQRSVVVGQRVGRGRIVAAVAVGKEHLGIVLGRVVELRRAVELIHACRKVPGEAGQRYCPLIARKNGVDEMAVDRGQVDVFLI